MLGTIFYNKSMQNSWLMGPFLQPLGAHQAIIQYLDHFGLSN